MRRAYVPADTREGTGRDRAIFFSFFRSLGFPGSRGGIFCRGFFFSRVEGDAWGTDSSATRGDSDDFLFSWVAEAVGFSKAPESSG